MRTTHEIYVYMRSVCAFTFAGDVDHLVKANFGVAMRQFAGRALRVGALFVPERSHAALQQQLYTYKKPPLERN